MNKPIKNETFINYHQMNELLSYAKKNFYCFVLRKKDDNEPFKSNAFIENSRVKFKMSLCIGRKRMTYTTRKDTEDVVQVVTGVFAYRVMRQHCEVPIIENAKELGSAVPLLYFNPKYNGKRQKAYAYDLNSAYSDAMKGLMPDTSSIVGENRAVKQGEIGFIEYDANAENTLTPKNDLIMVEEGEMADIIFKAMESPFKKFVDVWYGRKMKAKTREDKLKAKQILNFSVGYLQLKNPYIRATIVSRCNQRVAKLMDKNTLYCNTDSLVSRVPRPDLKIGSGLGEWKLEHEGMFAYKGMNYQWDKKVPTYRSVPKSWFKQFEDGWDILRDPIPKSHNIVEFDIEKLQLVKVNYEEIENEKK